MSTVLKAADKSVSNGLQAADRSESTLTNGADRLVPKAVVLNEDQQYKGCWQIHWNAIKVILTT